MRTETPSIASIIATLLLGAIILVGCKGGEETTRTMVATYDPTALDAFWRELIAAVEADDPERLAALGDFPLDLLSGEPGAADSITRDELINDYYPNYFRHSEWRAALLNADLSAVTIAGTGYALPLRITAGTPAMPERQTVIWTLYARRLANGEYRLGGMSFTR